MSTETTTTTTTEATTKAPAAPKAAKKASKKAVKAKPSTNGKAHKSGLRKPQIAILKCLNKFDRPLTRAIIAAKAPTDVAFLSTWIGAHDAATRKANEAKRGVKGLLTLGYVKAEQHDENGRDTIMYVITASGKAAMKKALEA